jgi:hypothetical protein
MLARFVALFAILSPGAALAQQTALTWITDPASGCSIVSTAKPEFQLGVSIRWLGECPNLLADGPGILRVRSNVSGAAEKYEGTFRNGVLTGPGSFENEGAMPSAKESPLQAKRYVGTFRNFRFHGTGKLFSADGDTYEGGFRDGEPFGKGTITNSKSGVKLECEWENMAPRKGPAVVHMPDGKQIVGTFDGTCFKRQGSDTCEKLM